MHRLILIILLFSSFSFQASFAQVGTASISGKIVSGNEGVNGATIAVLKLKDSSVVKMAVGDKTGAFELEKLAPGEYLLRASAISYANYLSEAIVLQPNQKLVIAPIELAKVASGLEGVRVTATRPLVENKIDKLVVNVEAAISNAGSTALDVLERSPGVTVDRDGNISLKGKQGVIILIDGKQTYLSAADLGNLLKNMPANQLDQVEIMSQPSAKYDAAGNSGIINIKTKKNQVLGYNGNLSLSYTQGRLPKTNNSFAFNRREGRVNLFATGAVSYNRNFFNVDLLRNISSGPNTPITSVFDQHSYNERHNQANSLKVGIDFFANRKTTLGAAASFTFINAGGSGTSSTDIFNGSNQLKAVNKAVTDFDFGWNNYTGNVNFRHLLDTSGKELTADVDVISYRKTNPGTTDNFTYDANQQLSDLPFLLQMSTPSTINIYTAKVDYVHPIKKVLKLEAGVKSSYVQTDNLADYKYFDHGAARWKTDSRTNHFLYDENINAAYLNASKQLKKWGIQAGLRVENTIAKGTQITNNKSFLKNYTQVFPTSYITYAANRLNTFALSFGRRIDRPNYQDMNPFVYFLDKFSYREGNPNLDPQFTHNIELSHNYKGQLNSSINYTRTTDVISDIFIQNNSDSSLAYSKQNIATRRNIGLAVNYNKAISKTWTLSFFANVFNNHFSGMINNALLDVTYNSFQINTSSQFKFKKGWSAEISALYNHRNIEGSSLAEPNGMLAFGGAKQILKNKGTIRLNVRDVLYTQIYRSTTKFDNLDMRSSFRADSRTIAIAFTYRFGKNQNNVPQRQRTNASQDELKRTGQGG
ncbi:outer membrane beta-barrel family protein [Aridibaculum aurantiacum]|uniref:outer membrane beta-barrel family protein n=1 Tax=Aridibaculum aurantiacum TaxID=2810307 RepID=UPI001A95CB3A|nr:outer membrane beta-barrel family protein [Aridibaculum aurantiacum]